MLRWVWALMGLALLGVEVFTPGGFFVLFFGVIMASLQPGMPGGLKARPDGTVLDGHHRIVVLRERGVDVDALPREVLAPERGEYGEMGAKVFWVAGPWAERLGIVPRPRGGEWLNDETRAWREAGIDVVVSLLEPREQAELALAREAVASAASGLEFRSFPIPDRGVPDSVESVGELTRHIVDALDAGKNVVVHCRQGIGRSALIAAAALVSGGQDAEAALQRVGCARGFEVPETQEQREWISDFSSRLADKRAGQSGAVADRLRRPLR